MGMTARAMAVAVAMGVGKKVVIQVMIVMIPVMGLIMTIQFVRDVRVGVGRCAQQGIIRIVGNCIIQAATIRALSLTAGRDRTKQPEGVTHAQQASTRTEQMVHALIVHLASTLP